MILPLRMEKIVGVNTKTDVVSGKRCCQFHKTALKLKGYGSVKLDEDFIMYEKKKTH